MRQAKVIRWPRPFKEMATRRIPYHGNKRPFFKGERPRSNPRAYWCPNLMKSIGPVYPEVVCRLKAWNKEFQFGIVTRLQYIHVLLLMAGRYRLTIHHQSMSITLTLPNPSLL